MKHASRAKNTLLEGVDSFCGTIWILFYYVWRMIDINLGDLIRISVLF